MRDDLTLALQVGRHGRGLSLHSTARGNDGREPSRSLCQCRTVARRQTFSQKTHHITWPQIQSNAILYSPNSLTVDRGYLSCYVAMELNGEMPGHQWCSATVHFVHGWRQPHKADDAFGRRQLSRLYTCAKETLFGRVLEQGLYIAMICGTCSYCKSCDCSLMDVRYISILVIIKMIWYLPVLKAWLSLSKVYHRSVSLNCCVYLRIVLHHVLCGLPEIRSEIFCCSLSQPEVVFKAGSVPAIPEWQEMGSCLALFRSVGLAIGSKLLTCP